MESLEGATVVYGGSFNPPHMGHQMACLHLLEGLGAAVVWLVPAWTHPFGKALAHFEHRVAMCRLLAAPFGARVEVSTVERELDSGGRTYDTLRHLLAAHPERRFTLAVGADILAEVGAWHRWRDIQAMVPVAVVGRQGYPAPPEDESPASLALPDVSSSDIRRRVCAGRSIAGLVPRGVAEYIESKGLYAGPEAG